MNRVLNNLTGVEPTPVELERITRHDFEDDEKVRILLGGAALPSLDCS